MRIALWFSLVLGLAACQSPTPTSEPAPEVEGQELELVNPAQVKARFVDGIARFPAPQGPFQQVGLRYEGPSPELRYQVRFVDGHLSAPLDAEVIFSEDRLHAARLVLPAPATELLLLSGADLDLMVLEFFPTVVAPRTRPATPLRAQLKQAVTPDGMVVTREQWGAREPDLLCNEPEALYYITIHHTAGFSSPDEDAAARMRQMQTYHMDNQGWCDIGYHFVVSQAGVIYEGRRDERRSAAHVGGHNSGNVGISFIGNFEEQTVPEAQMAAGARMLGWVARTYNIPFDRTHILGHREWADQSTACPGADLFSRLEELIERAQGGTVDPDAGPGPNPDEAPVAFGATWLSATTDALGDGRVDLFPGDQVEVAFTLKNASAGPLRGVKLGYFIDAGLRPVDYHIETDHPARDGTTFVVNDADSAPENPARDGLGSTGELTLYAFGAGETKRVRVTLVAGAYGVGRNLMARAYVRHVDDRYERASYDDAPTLDLLAGEAEGGATAELVSRDAWTFEEDTEGFSGCLDGALSQQDGALVVTPSGLKPCAVSPPWTAIQAADWDSLVLTFKSSGGAHDCTVFFAPTDGAFLADHAARFEVPGDGQYHTWVLPMDQIEGWSGEIGRLRFNLFEGGQDVPGRLEIGALYAQSRARQEAAANLPFEAATPVTFSTELPELDPDASVPAPDAGEEDAAPRPDARADAAPQTDGGWPLPPEEDTDKAAQDGGCQQGQGAPTPLWLLALLPALLRRRRA